MPLLRRFLTVAALTLALRATPCLAQPKTDIVELVNGDRITCEIRKLERGKLTVKTDGIGTISIEWDDVAHVASKANYDIELNSGLRYVGSLTRNDPRTLSVATAAGQERLIMDSVIRISPLGGSFWQRLDGSIDAGFNFTQANVQTQWTFDTSVSYRSRRWLSILDGDSSLTTREDADRQTRNNLSFQSQRFLRPRWSALGFSQFQQNEELSLNLRVVLGAGVQRVISQSNRSVVSVIGGAAYTREQYASEGDQSVAEAVAGLTLDWFTFDGRSTNLDISAMSFYALGETRTRLELNTTFKSDIVGDLYWSINLFESYNSSPPTGQKTNDFGISAAVGWSF
jgi:Protein of unknown function, DUF481